MKKNSILFTLCCLFSAIVFADEVKKDSVKYWNIKNSIILNSEQATLSNWSAGGYSSFAFSSFYKGFYNFKKGNNQWDNSVELAYGMIWQDKTGNGFKDPANEFQKSDDKIELNSIYSRKMYKSWNYSALVNIKSQFDEGFKDGKLVSAPISPITITSSIGWEYKNKGFSAMLSFLAGKTTIVTDRRLMGNEIFGFTEPGQCALFSLGSYAKFFYQKDIFKNVNLLVKLDFFYDYNKPILDTDINTEVFINIKVSKYLTAFINFQAIMDKDFNTTLQYKQRFGLSVPINF
jgi:hypothetical protein